VFILLNLLVSVFSFTYIYKERFVICCSSNRSHHILMILSLLSKISVYSRVGHRSLVLVVFIGGVTFAEIAALRFLSAQVCVVRFVSRFFRCL